MKNTIIILMLSLAFSVYAKSKPGFIPILNSRGYAKVLIKNDTLRIDTTGAGAYKKVVTDTSGAIEVDRASSLIYSYRLWSNGDSGHAIEKIACYDGGLEAWLYPTEYAEEGGADSVIAVDSTLSTYKRIEVEPSKCDKIKFIMSVPASAGHSDTIYIPNRFLRLEN